MTTVKCFCGMALSYVCDRDLGDLLDWRHSYLIPDVILIWYHYIVICTLVTIFNWWLSNKNMKLRVLIKEVLVVFYWLAFRIILLCSLASGHWALFLVQETTIRVSCGSGIWTHNIVLASIVLALTIQLSSWNLICE